MVDRQILPKQTNNTETGEEAMATAVGATSQKEIGKGSGYNGGPVPCGLNEHRGAPS